MRAVASRRREFATGRALLRDLLGATWRSASGPIGRRPGPPAPSAHWPTAGPSPSRSRPDAEVVAAFGVDLEPATASTRPRRGDPAAGRGGADAHLAFTLKEAVYKAWSALGAAMLEHHDVRGRAGAPGWFDATEVTGGTSLAGRFAVAGGYPGRARGRGATEVVDEHQRGVVAAGRRRSRRAPTRARRRPISGAVARRAWRARAGRRGARSNAPPLGAPLDHPVGVEEHAGRRAAACSVCDLARPSRPGPSAATARTTGHREVPLRTSSGSGWPALIHAAPRCRDPASRSARSRSSESPNCSSISPADSAVRHLEAAALAAELRYAVDGGDRL